MNLEVSNINLSALPLPASLRTAETRRARLIRKAQLWPHQNLWCCSKIGLEDNIINTMDSGGKGFSSGFNQQVLITLFEDRCPVKGFPVWFSGTRLSIMGFGIDSYRGHKKACHHQRKRATQAVCNGCLTTAHNQWPIRKLKQKYCVN